MQPHVQLYLKSFGLTVGCWIGCEVCNRTAVDIHHIEARGMGGTSAEDVIENLMALCRKCHDDYGDIAEFKLYLIRIHFLNMAQKGIHPPPYLPGFV